MCGIRKLCKYQFYRKPAMHIVILIMQMEKRKSTN